MKLADKAALLIDWVLWYAFLGYVMTVNPFAGIGMFAVTIALQGAAYIA